MLPESFLCFNQGFITILNYILNYYTGVDTEIRDPRGFTALIKAGLQGREDCVSALLMHGADMHAMDLVQGRGLKDWVLRTGRFETLNRIRRLQAHPVAEQFCESYKPEWPELRQLVEKATAPKTATQKLRQRLKESLTFKFPHDPQDNGVMDHMVRITTSIHSPLIITGSRPLCPTSPPEIGKRRFAVSELLETHSRKELEESTSSAMDQMKTTSGEQKIVCRDNICSPSSTFVRTYQPLLSITFE
uniref:Ankyrin repeat domain 33Aa n=1 Tax=Oryzias sinensis TaxID=183150 RepID=A0A8C7Z676_9TELE